MARVPGCLRSMQLQARGSVRGRGAPVCAQLSGRRRDPAEVDPNITSVPPVTLGVETWLSELIGSGQVAVAHTAELRFGSGG